MRTDPIGFSETLEQYRAKYALYRTDPALRQHALAVPDDLDLGRPRGRGQLRRRRRARPAGSRRSWRYTRARQAAAYRAFFESMPTYGAKGPGNNRIYRGMRFGKTVDLVLLDQRQYRADQPCGDRAGRAGRATTSTRRAPSSAGAR